MIFLHFRSAEKDWLSALDKWWLCVFVCDKSVLILYVDDDIFMSPEKNLIDKTIKNLIAVGLKVEDQGYSSDWIGVNQKEWRWKYLIVTASIRTKGIPKTCASTFHNNIAACIMI